MRLKNQHKAYVGVLGVALGAFAVDSLLLGGESAGPAQAGAAPASTPTTPAAPSPGGAVTPAGAAMAAAVATPAARVEAAARPRLATRLETLREVVGPAHPGLLFGPGAEWLNPPEKPALEAEPIAAALDEPTAAPAAKPVPVHDLTSVFVAGDRSCVILDGRTLRIGDVYDGSKDVYAGLKLTSVELRAATFERNGQVVRMVVPEK